MKDKSFFAPLRLCLLGAMTLVCCAAGLCWGSTPLTISHVLSGLLHPAGESVYTKILWVVRLPHVAACLLAGVGLGISGTLLQASTDNPLAGPNIIGVNAGAGFAMVLGLCFAPMAYRLQPLMAFVGAFACTMLILFVANKAGGSRVSIILTGVAVSALLNAGISLLKLIYPDMAITYNYFSVGGVSGVGFSDLLLPAVIICCSLFGAMILAGKMNLMCLGDDIAAGLGIRVKILRITALLLASASAAAAVSFAGLLGFVGLMVPHIARQLLCSADLRKILPAGALLGGSMVVLADLLGRTLFAPSEIPAGIVTALVGAPFFFVLLLQRRYRR